MHHGSMYLCMSEHEANQVQRVLVQISQGPRIYPRHLQIAGEWMVTRSLPKYGNNRFWPIAICDFYQCNIDTVSILGSRPVRSDPCDQVWPGPPEQAELRMVCLLWIRLGLNLQHILRQHLGLLPKRISIALLKVLKRGFMEGFCHDTFNNVMVLFSWLRLSKIASSLRFWPRKSCLKLYDESTPVQGPTSRNAIAEGRRQCHSSMLLPGISGISRGWPSPTQKVYYTSGIIYFLGRALIIYIYI